MRSKKLTQLFKEKDELIKEKQILYSWNWYYLNSHNSLFATRYHKEELTDDKGKKSIVDVYVRRMGNPGYGQAITYSRRAREDRRASIALNRSTKDILEKISNNHEEITEEYERIDRFKKKRK